MSLRHVLGADVGRVHEQVDALLDREDAIIVLVDRSRAINYASGFGLSPSQLEWLALEIEGAVRRAAGPVISNSADRRASGPEGLGRSARRDPVVHGHLRRVQPGRPCDMHARESGRPQLVRSNHAVRAFRVAGDASGSDAEA